MMRRRRADQHLSLGQVLDDLLGGFVAAVVIGAIVFGLSWVIYAGARDNHNMYAKDRIAIEKILFSHGEQANDNSEVTREKRKQVAQQITATESRSQEVSKTTLLRLTEFQIEKIKKTAETGDPTILPDKELWHWETYWQNTIFGWFAWFCFWVFFGFCAMAAWAMQILDYSDYRLADLPWRRGWPWLLTVLFGPVAWISMTVSAVNLRFLTLPAREENRGRGGYDYEPARDPDVRARWHVEDDPYRELLNRVGYLNDPDEDDETRARRRAERDAAERESIRRGRETDTFPDYDNEAGRVRKDYVEARIAALERYRVERLEEIGTLISAVKENARYQTEQLNKTRQQVKGYELERRALDDGSLGIKPTPDLAGEEFDRIVQLPGVIAAQRLGGGKFLFVVRATYEYEGELYDLCDWKIILGPGVTRMEAFRLRNGVRSDWEGGYPVYRHDEQRFCFGDRSGDLNLHVQKGEYLEAMAMAVESLSSINEGQEDRVPRAFKRIVRKDAGTPAETAVDTTGDSDVQETAVPDETEETPDAPTRADGPTAAGTTDAIWPPDTEVADDPDPATGPPGAAAVTDAATRGDVG